MRKSVCVSKSPETRPVWVQASEAASTMRYINVAALTKSELTWLIFVIRAKSTSSANMADMNALPVDASARLQHSSRALTAHRNFMATRTLFTKSWCGRNVHFDGPGSPSSALSRGSLKQELDADCSVQHSGVVGRSSSSCTVRTRPEQHVRMTQCLGAGPRN